MEPTAITYAELRQAYDALNLRLFDGALPACLLTLQRERRTYGYFSPGRFGNRDGGTTDEIALNPEYFAVVPVVEILQTLGHEMTHLWQQHFGTPGRGRYHNGEWADKMESIGLMPSSTGQPGGRRVGDHMADYVIEGGRFAGVVRELLETDRFRLTWYDRHPPPAVLYPPGGAVRAMPASAFEVPAHAGVAVTPRLPAPTDADRSNRSKFSCAGCGLNAWAKPSARLSCVECGLGLQVEGVERLHRAAGRGQPTRQGRRRSARRRDPILLGKLHDDC